MSEKFKEKEFLMSAVLSTLYQREQKDNIDLLMPFVKYSIGKCFSVGDFIDISKLSKFLADNFSYNIFPEALVLTIMNRMIKHDKERVIVRENKAYIYRVDLSENVQKFDEKRCRAEGLIDDVSKALYHYLKDEEHERVDENKARTYLFNFLDNYGVFAYKDINKIENISHRAEHFNYLVGQFVMREKQLNSPVFYRLVELVKGMILTKAVYLQTFNDTPINTKFQNILVFSDTSLLMAILGLKSDSENSIAKEFNDCIPKNVKKVFFSHTLDELKSILHKYIQNKERNVKNSVQTIEYFDKNEYRIDDVKDYMVRLETLLYQKGFTEWENDLPEDTLENETFDELGLKRYLQKNIPGYNSSEKEKMLENDIKSLSNIKRIRKGKNFQSIEKCRAIFVTSNFNLVKNVKEFLKIEGCHYIISHIDFIVLLWLKSNMHTDVPKQLLVTNAISATENVSEDFMKALCKKIDILKKENDELASSDISLLVEDYYVRKELMEKTKCDVDNLTVDTLVNVENSYKERIINEAQLNNDELVLKNKRLEEQNQELKAAIDAKNDHVREVARKKANSAEKSVVISLKVLMILFGGLLTVLGVYYTIVSVNVLNIIGFIIMALIGVYGVIDLSLKSCLILSKFVNWIGRRVYHRVYDKEYKMLMDTKKRMKF